jgi:PhnB protein
MPSRLNPYLNFDGKAREAIEFYHGVFGGDLRISTYGEGGMSQAPDDADRIMHAQIEAPNGMTLMASDVPPGTEHQEPTGIGISLSGDDDAELSNYWQKLSDGGTVTMPFEVAPWGDKFGMLTDRFGVPWMVDVVASQQQG